MKTLLIALLLSAGIAHAHDKPAKTVKTTHYVQYVVVNGVVFAQVLPVLPVLPETRTPEQIKRANEFKQRLMTEETPAHRYMREQGMFDNK